MSQELVARIRSEIERTGLITFARYMELALYDRDYGYYTRAIRVGRAGDYLTAPETHPIFGWVIAAQLCELWELLGRPNPFTLVEYGPGTGTLALAIFDYLARNEAELLDHLRYCPIERSSLAREALAARLHQAGFGHLAIESPRDPVTGVVLANEVLDALPVHRLRYEQGQLLELYVDWDGTHFVEVAGPLSTVELAQWLERLGVRLVEGQTTELCLAMLAWLDDVAQLLARGYLLVLDYGYPVPQRYDAERFPTGTIRTYAGHTVTDDPLKNPGGQDITAHVDFSMLSLAAQDRGLAALALTTQAEFLAHGGLGELLVVLQTEPGMTAERYLAARAAAFHLLDPSGMGRFHVALFGKNAPPEAVPTGFQPRLLAGIPLPSRSEESLR